MAAALQAHNRPDPGSGRPCLPNRPLDQPNHPRFEPVDREKVFSVVFYYYMYVFTTFTNSFLDFFFLFPRTLYNYMPSEQP